MVHAMGLEVYSVFAWLRRGRMGWGMVSDTSFRAVHETETGRRKDENGWTDKTTKRENRQLTSTAIRRGAAPPIFFSFLDWMDGIRR